VWWGVGGCGVGLDAWPDWEIPHPSWVLLVKDEVFRLLIFNGM